MRFLACSIALLAILFSCTANDSGASSLSSRFYNSLPSIPYLKRPQPSKWLTVDPKKILTILIKRGGLLMPSYIEDELKRLAEVCSVQESRLNLVNRQLELVNMAIGFKDGTTPALRIGRVRVEWDSYLKPCVEVEVEQVEILVEFTNLLLTRTNWNELNDAGFPPSMLMSSSSNDSPTSSTFVRIGSIEFGGNVEVRFQSRPLDELLAPDLILPLSQVQGLSAEIQQRAAALQRLEDDGRPGCTTTEVYDITTTWFQGKIRSILKQAVLKAAAAAGTGTTSTTTASALLQEQAQRMTKNARSFLSNYAQTASNKVLRDKVEKHVLDRLGGILPQPQVDRVKELSQTKINLLTDGTVLQQVQQSEWFRSAYESLKQDDPVGVDKDTFEFPENVQFPDW